MFSSSLTDCSSSLEALQFLVRRAQLLVHGDRFFVGRPQLLAGGGVLGRGDPQFLSRRAQFGLHLSRTEASAPLSTIVGRGGLSGGGLRILENTATSRGSVGDSSTGLTVTLAKETAPRAYRHARPAALARCARRPGAPPRGAAAAASRGPWRTDSDRGPPVGCRKIPVRLTVEVEDLPFASIRTSAAAKCSSSWRWARAMRVGAGRGRRLAAAGPRRCRSRPQREIHHVVPRRPEVRWKSAPLLETTCTNDSTSAGKLSASAQEEYPPGFTAKPKSEIEPLLEAPAPGRSARCGNSPGPCGKTAGR